MTDGKLRKIGRAVRRTWDFLWHGKSIWSYIAFILVSFLFLKYLAYPGLLFIMGWRDLVAVLSNSMYHGSNINSTYYSWLEENGYNDYGNWIFPNGLNVGDVVIVVSVPPEEMSVGNVIVFIASDGSPIIHRVVNVTVINGVYYYKTKGDANTDSLPFERNIPYEVIVGKAIASAPLVGYPRVLMSYILGV